MNTTRMKTIHLIHINIFHTCKWPRTAKPKNRTRAKVSFGQRKKKKKKRKNSHVPRILTDDQRSRKELMSCGVKTATQKCAEKTTACQLLGLYVQLSACYVAERRASVHRCGSNANNVRPCYRSPYVCALLHTPAFLLPLSGTALTPWQTLDDVDAMDLGPEPGLSSVAALEVGLGLHTTTQVLGLTSDTEAR